MKKPISPEKQRKPANKTQTNLMKTIFDPSIRESLISRIQSLSADSPRQWGKMSLYQMLAHNTYWNAWVLGQGEHTYRQTFLGKLWGKRALRQLVKDEKPLDKNIPASSQFIPKQVVGDFAAEKVTWMALVQEYQHFSNPGFIHEFMGKMSREAIGILVYKHTDHHLRQFGG